MAVILSSPPMTSSKLSVGTAGADAIVAPTTSTTATRSASDRRPIALPKRFEAFPCGVGGTVRHSFLARKPMTHVCEHYVNSRLQRVGPRGRPPASDVSAPTAAKCPPKPEPIRRELVGIPGQD